MKVKERRQLIALCAQTYVNLNGNRPDAVTLCRWLDDSYLREIILYLNENQGQQRLCG